MKIFISITDASGDMLAARLIKVIRKQYPDASIVGLIGDKAKNAGALRIWHTNLVNIMGFSDVLIKIVPLLMLRQKIIDYCLRQNIDTFIGVDGPDFNFYIEKKLKKKLIKTIHFISPSIWAWRMERIHYIKKSTDIMLCLLPFEKEIYQQHDIESYFVGHPLTSMLTRRETYTQTKKILLMPGSRLSEIKHNLPIMLATAKNIMQIDSKYQFHIVFANNDYTNEVAKASGDNIIFYSIGDAYYHINNSDLVIVASGTASLEVALIGTPQVVVYKVSKFNHKIIKNKLTTKFVSLPNIVLNKDIVIELLQDDFNQVNLAKAVFDTLKNSQAQLDEFKKLPALLAENFDEVVVNSLK